MLFRSELVNGPAIQVSYNGASGITLTGATISGNQLNGSVAFFDVDDNGSAAMVMDRVSISGNTKDGTGAFIECGAGVDYTAFSVSNNVADGRISINGSSGSCTEISIINNTLEDNTANPIIYVVDCDEVNIAGNTLVAGASTT